LSWELGDGTLLSLTVHFLGNKFLCFNRSLSWELQGTNFFVLSAPCLGNFMGQITLFSLFLFLGISWSKFPDFNSSFSWELHGTNFHIVTAHFLGNFVEQISLFKPLLHV
jgi:hypothetical protein